MAEIILSEEQKKAVEYNYPKAYAIKGIAGSGKTTVGINRIPFLLKKCTKDSDKILVVTFHKTLVNYLEHLVSEQLVEFRGKFNFDQSNWSGKLKVISIDDLMDEYYDLFKLQHAAKYPKLPKEVAQLSKINNLFKKAINLISQKYPDASFLKLPDVDFLLEEVQYLISNRIDTEQKYQGYTRNGRNRFKFKNINLKKKSKERKIIFDLRTKYVELQLNSGVIDRFYKRRLALLQIIKTPPKNITHLVIDEAQDLDRVQFDFLKQFPNESNDASATFLYDPSQSIHANSWLGNGNPFSHLGIDIKGKSRSLNKNFRTTFEIQDAAISVLKDNESDSIRKELTNKSNAKPFVIPTDGKKKQSALVVNILKTLSTYEDLKDIIIASSKEESLTYLKDILSSENIASTIIKPRDKTFGLNRVRLMTLKATKGLECKAIILIDINEGLVPQVKASDIRKSRDRKLLYVAMTRATKYLYILSSHDMSSFVNEIEDDKVHIINGHSFPQFVPVEDPKIRLKIDSILNDIALQFQNTDSIKKRLPRDENEWRNISDLIFQTRMNFNNIKFEIDNISKLIDPNSFIAITLKENIKSIEDDISRKENELSKKQRDPICKQFILSDLCERYANFSEKSMTVLQSIIYKIRKENISGNGESDLDWGNELNHFSKILQIELPLLYEFKGFNIQLDGQPKLYEYIKDLKERKELNISLDFLSIIRRMNNRRNKGIHEEIVSFEELKKFENDFLKEEGILKELDTLLK